MGTAKLPEKIIERMDSEINLGSDKIRDKYVNYDIFNLKKEIEKLKSENDRLKNIIVNLKNNPETVILRKEIRSLKSKLMKFEKSKSERILPPTTSVMKAKAIRKIMKKKGDDPRSIVKAKSKKASSR
jgi:hypothetical protein